MKVYIIIMTILLAATDSFSQNIVDIFLTVPDSSVLNLDNATRKQIVKYSMNNKSVEDAHKVMRENNIGYSFEVADIKNGFIKLIGSFEGQIQMCYWNMKNGEKLIAIYQEGCGPVCYIERFDFYKYNGKVFKAVASNKIIPEMYNDFFQGDVSLQKKEMEKHEISATLLFDLPRKGLNITAKWGNAEAKEVYEKYAKGNRMTLIWNDGVFKKGNIFWE
jgi:hypothetical protein